MEVINPQMARVSTKDSAIALFALFSDWAIIIGTMVGVGTMNTWWAWALGIFIIGTRQHALAIWAHDAVHNLIFSRKKYNMIAANVMCFWPLGGAAEGYRDFHMRHHRYLGKAGDPEVLGRKTHATQAPSHISELIKIFVTDLCGLGLFDQIKTLRDIRTNNPKHLIGPALMWIVIAALLIHFNVIWVAILWWVPAVTSFWAIFRVRMFFEHPNGVDTLRFQANPLLRFVFFPHHTYCHYEHHEVAFVPFHKLPELRKQMTLGHPSLVNFRVALSQMLGSRLG
jgi:fatty acid desaturase